MQSDHAELLEMVFEALSETLVRGSSEVDEALCRLQLTNQQLRDDHFGVAIGLLHRWQGRNGRIGNADPHHGRTSGAGEA